MTMDQKNQPDDWAQQLDAYLDGELAGPEAEAFAHLRESDPAVDEALRQAESLEAQLTAMREPDLDIDWDSQREEILAQVARRPVRARPVVRLVLRPALAAAAVAAMVLLAINVFRPSEPTPTSSGPTGAIAHAAILPAFPAASAQAEASGQMPRMSIAVSFENTVRDLSTGSVVISVGAGEKSSPPDQVSEGHGDSSTSFMMY